MVFPKRYGFPHRNHIMIILDLINVLSRAIANFE